MYLILCIGYSNGLKDPWMGSGVLESLTESVIAVIIPEGAHHLDLRSSNPADPPSVRAARKIYKEHIIKWISEFKN
jgi:lysosomal Pro-X carboxypeptidase